MVDGHEQDPIDGTSFVYTFDSATAPEQKKTQYFEIMGSRGIYHEGWMASTFGPRTPWMAEMPDVSQWDPDEGYMAVIRYSQGLLADARPGGRQP